MSGALLTQFEQYLAAAEPVSHGVCEARGYCGPFVNQARYDLVPGWEGIADCALCRSTVQTAGHEARRLEALGAVGMAA